MLRMLVFVTIGLLMAGCSERSSPTGPQDFGEWPSLDDLFCCVTVDFETDVAVGDAQTAEQVFAQFMKFKRAREEDLFFWGTHWQFEGAVRHGTFRGTKYWWIDTSLRAQDGERYVVHVFDVSQNGEVVRLSPGI